MALDLDVLKEELIKEFRLEALSSEQQEELLSKMGESLLKHVFIETMDAIGDNGVKEYEKLLDREATAEELEAFFESRIPGYNGFVREVVEKFKAEMKEAAEGKEERKQ